MNSFISINTIFYVFTLLLSGSYVKTADLRSDLREFVSLIPRRRIGYIAARHYVFDSHFRQAMNFIRSPEFKPTWHEIRDSSEFHKITDYLVSSVPNSTDIINIINNVPARLRSFRLPAKVPIKVLMFERNLGSFLKEVLNSLPRERIASFMARKVMEGNDFSALYKSLRRNEFRQLIDETRNSPSLTEVMERISQHSIIIDDLIETGFSILNWGPKV